MSIVKHVEYFNPMKCREQVHVIGVGAIGSHIAEQLARLGIDHVHLWDFDTVEAHNIANQQYTHADISKPKVIACYDRCTQIKPNNTWVFHNAPWDNHPLYGHIFLAVDNIELRKRITLAQKFNNSVRTMLDFRMRLEDAQHFAADWKRPAEREIFLKTMDFTSAEAEENTPVSACNMALSIIPTVSTVVSAGVANWINHLNGKGLNRLIMVNPFMPD